VGARPKLTPLFPIADQWDTVYCPQKTACMTRFFPRGIEA
jgi:hypothetical protein